MFANLFLAIVFLLSGAAAATTEGPVACATEDSTNCYWNASEQGNGEGVDFHDIDGVAYYECDGYEDSANCFWDATKQGNGKGRSFTDVNGVAIYWDTL